MEDNFDTKVLAHVRQRRACQFLAAALDVPAVVPAPPPWESQASASLALDVELDDASASPALPAVSPSTPQGAGCASTGSRFMSSACLPRVHADRWARAVQRSPALSPGLAEPEQSVAEAPAPPPVVESARRIAVIMEEGEEEVLPPYTWVVLEEPLQAGGVVATGHLKLSQVAGGGVIKQSYVSALRNVPLERLSAPAAESNFRRAGRGASLVALRHATLALALFGDVEPPHQPGYVPSISPDGGPVFRRPTDQELLARAHRISAIVACHAAAAAQRQSRASTAPGRKESPSSRARSGAAKEEGAASDDDAIPGKSAQQKGFKALNDFHAFALRRFQNPVRAWFMLDAEENMKLGQKVFERRCVDIGFRGNTGAMWKFIDADGSGAIGITEFAPEAAKLLARLKALVQERFHDNVSEFFAHVDTRRRGRLNKAEFVEAMRKLDFAGATGTLFDYLDRLGVGMVSVKEIAFMSRWSPPPYLLCAPNKEGLRELRGRFMDTYGSPLRVWRRCLDRKGDMSISWDEFIEAVTDVCKKTGHQQYELQELASIWRAIDEDCSGSISLKEWDAESYAALAEFKLWADRVHGGAVKAFRVLDGNSGNARLSEGELQKARRGPNGCTANLVLIHEGLDIHDAWALTENDIRFLDSWDLAWDAWVENARAKGSTGFDKKSSAEKLENGVPRTA